MSTLEEVKSLLDQSLNLGGRALGFSPDTQLLGALPELDSMAIVAFITSIEEFYGFTVEDDEISADTLETVGSVVAFVERKLQT